MVTWHSSRTTPPPTRHPVHERRRSAKFYPFYRLDKANTYAVFVDVINRVQFEGGGGQATGVHGINRAMLQLGRGGITVFSRSALAR